MKTSASATWALAATFLLSCTACTKTPSSDVARRAAYTDYQLKNLLVLRRPNVYVASPALLSRALNIAPLKEQFLTPCTGAPPIVDRVVKVRINNGFDVKTTVRDIVSKKPGGGGAQLVPEPTLNPNSTTYDMKLDKSVWTAADKIIAVKIILKDDLMNFLDDKYSVTTVETPTLSTSSFLCLAPIEWAEDKGDNEPEGGPDTGKPKSQVVTFYVDKAQIQSRKFNIRVVVFNTDGVHVLPLILDPAVENNGFN